MCTPVGTLCFVSEECCSEVPFFRTKNFLPFYLLTSVVNKGCVWGSLLLCKDCNCPLCLGHCPTRALWTGTCITVAGLSWEWHSLWYWSLALVHQCWFDHWSLELLLVDKGNTSPSTFWVTKAFLHELVVDGNTFENNEKYEDILWIKNVIFLIVLLRAPFYEGFWILTVYIKHLYKLNVIHTKF